MSPVSRPYYTCRCIIFIMLITLTTAYYKKKICNKDVYNPCKGNATFFGKFWNITYADERRCISPLNSPLSIDDAREECKKKNSILLELLGEQFKETFDINYTAEVVTKYPNDPTVWLNAKYNKADRKLDWLSEEGQQVWWYRLPFNLQVSQKCFAMTLSTPGQAKIKDVDCSSPRPFFCYSKDFLNIYKGGKTTLHVHYPDAEPPPIYKERRSIVLGCRGAKEGVGPIDRFSYVLRLNISDGSRLMIYRMDHPYNTNKTSRNKEDYVTRNGTCQRIVWESGTGFIKLPRTSKPEGYKGEWICRRHTSNDFNVSFTCADDDITCAKSSFLVKVINKTPRSSALYHQPPKHMFINQTAIFTCKACVGWYGNVSWTILTKDPRSYSDKLTQTLFDLDDERISYETVRGNITCGLLVTSTLNLLITTIMYGMNTSCKSFMWVYGKRIHHMESRGKGLALIRGPTRLTMKVYYHNRLNEVIKGRNLIAFCRACYVRMGEIQWSLLTNDHVQVELSAFNITFEIQKYKPLYNVKGCTIYVTSHITVQVSPDLANKSLMCQSFQYKYFKDSTAFAKSVELRVVPEPPDRDPTETSTWKIFSLFFILTLLLAIGTFTLASSMCQPARNGGEEVRVVKDDIPIIEVGIHDDMTVITAVDAAEGSTVDGDAKSIRSNRSHRSSKSNPKSADGDRQSRRPSHVSSIRGPDATAV